MKKILFIVISTILFGVFSCAEAQKEKPNIIFILADDLGYGDVGAYGQEVIQTPYINKLATEGMKFTQAYAGSTVCAPSRCALLTGYHMGKAIIRNNGIAATGERISLPDSALTAAEVLQAQGYTTGVFGKWGLGEIGSEGLPNNQGFDEFYGYISQGRAHKYFVDYAWHNNEKVQFPENKEGKKNINVAEWYFEKLKDFIKEKKDEPFFIYYATQLPHAEMASTEKDLQQYLTADGESIFEEVPYKGGKSYGATDIPYATYAAMISQLDRHVGEIGALLKEVGIDDNTIIIFTSDNGPEKKGGILPSVFNSNGELRGIKRDLYEGGIRVPMIVKWPGKTEPGTISNYPWASWDFLPTVADILNVPAPEGIDGVSALPVFLGEEMDRPNELYWEFITPTNSVKMAVRNGKWKGVVNGLQNEMELYDMEADPGESNNLSTLYPEKVKELKKLIKKTREQSVYWKIDEALLAEFYEN